MGISEAPELVDFDAKAALEAGREIAGDTLLSCTEYTRKDFHVLYASDRAMSQYGDREQMEEHFGEILSYCYMDFSDRQLFEQEFPVAGRVEYFLTRMDHGFVARLITESQGLVVFFAGEAPLDDAVAAMREVILDTDEVDDSPYSTS
jgi:hypothetical protein